MEDVYDVGRFCEVMSDIETGDVWEVHSHPYEVPCPDQDELTLERERRSDDM